jgi:hypothetical protein
MKRATTGLILAAVLGVVARDAGSENKRNYLPTPKPRLVVAGRPTSGPVSRVRPGLGVETVAPRPTSTPMAGPSPDQQPPSISSPTPNQVLPGGGQMLIKLQPYPGSSVTKFDVELQKKVSGVWQVWATLTYDSAANPNGVYQQTGVQNPERRVRARSQGVNQAQWTAWVDFTLQ